MVSPTFLLLSLFIVQFSLAYEFLAWTSDDQTTEFEENPWEYIKKSIKSASAESPVYLFAILSTTVEQVSKSLNESSNRPPFRQISNEEKIKVASDANEVQYFLFNNYEDYTARTPVLDGKFVAVLSDAGSFNVQVERRKRVSLNTEDEDDQVRGKERQGSKVKSPKKPTNSRQSSRTSFRRPSGSGKSYSMPVVLPPFYQDKFTPKDAEDEHGTCLFYLESLTVYVFNKNSEEPFGCGATIGSLSNNDYVFSSDSVNCIQTLKEGTIQEFSFNVDVTAKKTSAVCRDKTLFTVDGTISVKLTFQTVPGYYWKLAGIETDGFSVNGKSRDWLNEEISVASGSQASESSINYMEIGAPLNYNYACSQTKTAIFETDHEDYHIGISFGNIQVQPIGYSTDESKKGVHFSRNVYDCVGTFSTGSLMGIIVALVFASIFMFAFLMLNSVKSVDRFDDPKMKQILINFKE